MKISADWTVRVTEDSLVAESADSLESFSVSEFVSAPHVPVSDRTPQRIIDREIELLSPPDPEAPETYTIDPHRRFNLPCGEPASVVVDGLGGNLFVATYAIASDQKMYRLNFYNEGEIVKRNRYYQQMVQTARVNGFSGSTCLGGQSS